MPVIILFHKPDCVYTANSTCRRYMNVFFIESFNDLFVIIICGVWKLIAGINKTTEHKYIEVYTRASDLFRIMKLVYICTHNTCTQISNGIRILVNI